MTTVIVFGPTGNVGSNAALMAQAQGAKVFLAMRDTTKIIPGLSAEQERERGFERIQADLTNADSVTAAVKASGAKRAFFYLAHGTPDHMRATIQALKASGIELPVFLSSYTIAGAPRDISPSDVIPYVHAQVELCLDETYGPNGYVALRPGGFATNFLRYKAGVMAGDVKIHAPDLKFDGIAPGDIGRVAGSVLANGARGSQRKVYLYGPHVLSQRDGLAILAKALGKEVKITRIGAQDALDQYLSLGMPKPVAEYIVRISGEEMDEAQRRPHYEEGVANVELYTGKSAVAFEQWIETNKELLTA